MSADMTVSQQMDRWFRVGMIILAALLVCSAILLTTVIRSSNAQRDQCHARGGVIAGGACVDKRVTIP